MKRNGIGLSPHASNAYALNTLEIKANTTIGAQNHGPGMSALTNTLG